MNEIAEEEDITNKSAKVQIEVQDDPYMVNALVRGLEVLGCFTSENPSLSLTDLAHQLGWSRTAPFRLVYTLQRLGYLQQEPHTKRYHLTSKVLQLGFEYLHSLQLTEIARPFLEQVRDATGASAHLGILDRYEVVYVGRVPTRMAASSNVHVGSRLPAHATSMGKVLLAYQPATIIEGFLKSAHLTACTTHTITDRMALQAELHHIKITGLAFSDEEYELGIRSIAAPVFDHNGSVLAAINISAPGPILNSGSARETTADIVKLAARDISAWLGYKQVLPNKSTE